MEDDTKPWETGEGKEVWPTKSSFFTYIRGGLRRGLWMKHPLKLKFLHLKREKLPIGRKTKPNPEGLIWGCRCEICGNPFKIADVQVDHKKGGSSLKTVDDLKDFIMSITFSTYKDFQVVCKPCHKIKSHSEARGISFEKSAIEKEVIQIIKTKKDKEFLESKGITPAGNAKGRKEQLVKYFEEGK